MDLKTEIETILKGIDVPRRTGNLANSIKVRITETGYQVYLDTQQAPYALQIEEMNPFWNRVCMTLSYKLSAILGKEGYLTEGGEVDDL